MEVCQNLLVPALDVGPQKDRPYQSDFYRVGFNAILRQAREQDSFDTFTFAVLNITIKYKCIFEKKSCSELTLTLVLNDYELNQTATLLIGEPSQLEL
ncbi:hypothetical protein HMPREF1077_01599 [Parabacteroides johnsonii CL02T12C29]|uniref:Uncharacterized protein n=2 Tax=Parabacteroides TaxID=375288 RepID=K5ZIQ6_9BACT|nr:hypothetical protein HMPREF1077_01599 [Parabacteroides johnsonii CL02T12C29]